MRKKREKVKTQKKATSVTRRLSQGNNHESGNQTAKRSERRKVIKDIDTTCQQESAPSRSSDLQLVARVNVNRRNFKIPTKGARVRKGNLLG